MQNRPITISYSALVITLLKVLKNQNTVHNIMYVKVAVNLKHLCFFCKQREASESASFNLIPISHNIKGFYVQICRRGSPGGEI